MRSKNIGTLLALLLGVAVPATAADRPHIVFIMSDDHAAHAISAYGSRVNRTPNIDRIAREGALLESVMATNALPAAPRFSPASTRTSTACRCSIGSTARVRPSRACV